MDEKLEQLQADREVKYRSALLYSSPIFVALSILTLEVTLGLYLIPHNVTALFLFAGFITGAVPIQRHHKAKLAVQAHIKAEQNKQMFDALKDAQPDAKQTKPVVNTTTKVES